METLLNLLVDLGILGAAVLLIWGAALCSMLRFGSTGRRGPAQPAGGGRDGRRITDAAAPRA